LALPIPLLFVLCGLQLASPPPERNIEHDLRALEELEPPLRGLELKAGTFAWVEAELEFERGKKPRVRVASTAHGRRYVATIQKRLQRLLEKLEPPRGHKIITRRYELGTPVALPVREWVDALRRGAPLNLRSWPDVASSRKSCVAVIATIAHGAAIDLGMEGLGVAPQRRFHPLLSSFLGKPEAAIYFLDRETMLLIRFFGYAEGAALSKPPRANNSYELCVEPIGEELRNRWRTAIDERETCLSEDLYEAVTGDGILFPRDRRFVELEVTHAQACARDERGVHVCCGDRAKPVMEFDGSTVELDSAGRARATLATGRKIDWAGPYRKLIHGGDRVCAVSKKNELRCEPEVAGAPLRALDVAINDSGHTVWVIDDDARLLRLRADAPPEVVAPARATVAARGGVMCSLGQDGSVLCKRSKP
jgi:hypothetical protein